MRELEHKWIDVLKTDIEGGEWDVLEALIDTNYPLDSVASRVSLPTSVSEEGHQNSLQSYRSWVSSVFCGTKLVLLYWRSGGVFIHRSQ